MKTGIFKLADADREALITHFLQLPLEDRRFRFGCAISNDAIRAFVAKLNLDYVTGYFLFGQLAAVGFLAPEDASSEEFAISVGKEFRGNGLGLRLLNHSIEHLGQAGTSKLVIRHANDNIPMANLYANMESTRKHEGSDIIATLDPRRICAAQDSAMELVCGAEA